MKKPLLTVKVFVALSSAEGYQFRLGSIGPDPMEPSMQLVSRSMIPPRNSAPLK